MPWNRTSSAWRNSTPASSSSRSRLSFGVRPRNHRREIEAAYGYSKVSREVAQTPVPLFVEWKEPPESTLFHAIFTNEPTSIP